MDCGPASMALFREKVLASKTVIWNGPAGVFEFDTFSKGTKVSPTLTLTLTRNPNPNSLTLTLNLTLTRNPNP